jgi:hypothetical protein
MLKRQINVNPLFGQEKNKNKMLDKLTNTQK